MRKLIVVLGAALSLVGCFHYERPAIVESKMVIAAHAVRVNTGSHLEYNYGLNYDGEMGFGWHSVQEYSPGMKGEEYEIRLVQYTATEKQRWATIAVSKAVFDEIRVGQRVIPNDLETWHSNITVER